MWIDSHAHLTMDAYQGRIDEVLARSCQACVTAWITVGTDLPDSRAAADLCQIHPTMFAAAGVHPHEADKQHSEYIQELQPLFEAKKVCALGEIGLDYHYEFSPRRQQQELFRRLLELADQVRRPVIIHCREAFDDCLAILDEWGRGAQRMVFHCFSGDLPQAQAVLDRGGFLSFTGTITFRNTSLAQQVAAYVPLDRLMLETDCPYLSPEPKRNVRPNEPALLVHTAQKLAQLRQMPLEKIAQQTTENCRSFFKLDLRNDV